MDQTAVYEDNLIRLSRARLLNEKGIIKSLAQKIAIKLNEEIAKGHETTAFLIALGLSAVKDILDIFELGFPIFSFFIALILFYFLFSKGHFLRIKIKLIWWILGFIIDNLPAFSLLPINTIMVLWAWRLVHKKAKSAEEKLENLNEMTRQELEELDENIDSLGEE